MLQLTTCSRQIFAFSRDGGLPFSRWLYNVNSRTRSPVNCVWFAAFLSSLLGLLAFVGKNAIGAIFSSAVTSQYLAYSIPISARFLGHKEIKRGPFSLGRWVGLRPSVLLTTVNHILAEHTRRRDSRYVDGLHNRCFPLPRFPIAY